jgi:hypothetical protein
MKSLIATASIAAAALAAPVFAQAQDAPSVNGAYGTLGYANTHSGGADLGAIQGRLGYRMNWLGVEGELSGGVKSDHVAVAPGVDARVKLSHQEAIYGVGFVPLSPKFDLIGRVGYGHTKVTASAAGARAAARGDSWNFGGGAQYRFDGVNGIRADYTREEFQRTGGGHANVWSVAYTRRF